MYQPLDSSFRWNDDGVLFRLYIIPACLPQTGSCYFLHTQSTCDLTHSELKRAMKDDLGEIFTLNEVAAYLKVGKRTVYRLTAARKIPAFKVGGTWRFQRRDIDYWIKLQTAKAHGDDVPGESCDDNG